MGAEDQTFASTSALSPAVTHHAVLTDDLSLVPRTRVGHSEPSVTSSRGSEAPC